MTPALWHSILFQLFLQGVNLMATRNDSPPEFMWTGITSSLSEFHLLEQVIQDLIPAVRVTVSSCKCFDLVNTPCATFQSWRTLRIMSCTLSQWSFHLRRLWTRPSDAISTCVGHWGQSGIVSIQSEQLDWMSPRSQTHTSGCTLEQQGMPCSAQLPYWHWVFAWKPTYSQLSSNQVVVPSVSTPCSAGVVSFLFSSPLPTWCCQCWT